MKDKVQESIDNLNQCENCQDIQIKKFTPIVDYEDYDNLNGDFLKCVCGKRPLDVVMANILKIMIEENIVSEKATLRRNSPIPMPAFCYSSLNPQFINEDALILIHPDFNQSVAKRLFEEIPEVKGVLKGSGSETIGILSKDADLVEFKLLAGKSDRIDVLRTLIPEKIVISKDQRNSHIEVASTTESKLLKLYNYLENTGIGTDLAIDGMCGSGAIGIFLLKYGFKKVIFNDINPQAIINLKTNLKLNNISEDSYEIYNEPIETLSVPHVDLAIIDAFPNVDVSDIKDKLETVSENILEI
ncbi:MAG: 50S ribosomal protein L11 methyltransferase [Methanobrevibacter sp.]|uniref:50S ribosomal protein L11 methyltransferase n=1 Tax=Methanobrevibacter sp. TaxID=66852 RepID=UPI0026E0D0E8|nr:50S ribosomal protein L11 methyltransferase [Methanobrevibacter sp.]MDO5848410.1 50S ribosomal protein L11 methyltransferase [Methanobrevibacter sp.]